MARRTDSKRTTRPAETVEPALATGDQVLAFLRANPTFLCEQSAALAEVDAPSRPLGEGITDFQQVMIERLRNRVEETTEVAQELIDTSRDNLNNQARVHECVLTLLSATSFEQLIQYVSTDLAVILDLDTVCLCIESTGPEFPVDSVTLVPSGFVDRIMGKGKDLQLRADISGDPEIFEAAAPLVRSQALVRLTVSSATPPCLLAFGSRAPEKFNPGQATDLLAFLSSVLAQLIRIWLDLPE